MTRDSWYWKAAPIVAIILSVITTVADPASLHISPLVMNWLKLIFTVLAALGFYSTSPLAGENDANKVNNSSTKVSLVLLTAALAGSISLAACATLAPGHSPEAQSAFQKGQIVKALDVIRDTATDANAQTPALLSTETTRKVVKFHQDALNTIKAAKDGWPATVIAAADGVLDQSSPAEKQLLTPYVDLAKALLKGLTQ